MWRPKILIKYEQLVILSKFPYSFLLSLEVRLQCLYLEDYENSLIIPAPYTTTHSAFCIVAGASVRAIYNFLIHLQNRYKNPHVMINKKYFRYFFDFGAIWSWIESIFPPISTLSGASTGIFDPRIDDATVSRLGC